MRIGVIGAGIIGATIAWRLRRAGAKVFLIEARTPATGTTGASFAWLTSFPQMSWNEDAGRALLRRNLNNTYLELESSLGGDWLKWTGTLTDLSALPEAETALSTCRELGVKLEVLQGKDLAELAPEVNFGPCARAVYETHSGWIDAPQLVYRLIERFTGLEGQVVTDAAVVEILQSAGRVTGLRLTDGRTIETDWVVNASGSWGVHVAALAGIAFSMELIPGVMVYAGAGRIGLPRHIINGPDWLVRPDREFGLAIHWRGGGLVTDHSGNGSDPNAILADVSTYIPALKDAKLSAVKIGIRAIPRGGPVLGSLPWLPGFYNVISHGGVGWAPTWAEMCERELLHGENVDELCGMRPARFYIEPQHIGRFADDAEMRTSQ